MWIRELIEDLIDGEEIEIKAIQKFFERKHNCLTKLGSSRT
jgi:hypothetical protein